MAAAALDIDMSRKSKAGFRLPFQSQAFFCDFFVTQRNASSHVIRLVCLRARIAAYQQNARKCRGPVEFRGSAGCVLSDAQALTARAQKKAVSCIAPDQYLPYPRDFA